MWGPAPIRQLAAAPTIGVWSSRCACLVVLLVMGCETEQHERFRDFNAQGVHLYQLGHYQEAREHFEVAVALEPQDANVQYNLGQCCDRLGQADRAETYYKQCLQGATNHAECRHALAVLLYRGGRRAEADAMIEGWLIAQPELSAAYALDGWRLRRCGDFDHAIGRFQQALHYDARNVHAMIELGQIYEEQDHIDYALAMYKRALGAQPQQPELQQRVDQLRAKGVGPPRPD
jgi:tetratricopeptide (TPR) repeat protein